MLSQFTNFKLDLISFIIGMVVASIFWWAALKLGKKAPAISVKFNEFFSAFRERYQAGIDSLYRDEIYRQTQFQHIASMLFPLEDILIPPRLLLPPPLEEEEQTLLSTTIAAQVIPYLPDWPQLSAEFNSETITIEDLLESKLNFALMGLPGSGKSVALAHLTSLLTNKNHVYDFVPVYLHFHDLDFSVEITDSLDKVIKAVSYKAASIAQNKLPRYIRSAFQSGQGMLILDGLDELAPDELKKAVSFLQSLFEKYPKTRLATTAHPDFTGELLNLSITPFTLAHWNHSQCEELCNKWTEQWEKNIQPAQKKQPNDIPDNKLFHRWLTTDLHLYNPFEWTLILWSAFSGDSTGLGLSQAYDAYLSRMCSGVVSPEALETMAIEMLNTRNSALPEKRAIKLIGQSKLGFSEQGLFNLIDNRIILESETRSIRFASPIIVGLLAGKSKLQSTILDNSDVFKWSISTSALQFSASKDVPPDQSRQVRRVYNWPMKWIPDPG